MALGDGAWIDITSLTGRSTIEGRVDNYEPFDSSMIFYLGADSPLRPEVGRHLTGCQGLPCPASLAPRLEVEAFLTTDPPGRAALAQSLETDGLSPDDALLQAPFGYRLRLGIDDQGHFAVFSMDLGGVPTRALARAEIDLRSAQRAGACAASGWSASTDLP